MTSIKKWEIVRCAMDSELSRILGAAEFFAGLSPQGRMAVAALLRRRTLRKREHLFLEGQPGDRMYLLEAGNIQLVKTSSDGREIVIRTVQPGEIFAEAVIFERDAYPVSAVAVRRSAVYELHRIEFLRLLDDRTFRQDFIRSLIRRVRYLTERILYLSAYDVEERFFRFLLAHHGRQKEYVVALSRKDVAAEIGVTPETFSRMIRRLAAARRISWNGRTLRIAPGILDKIEAPAGSDRRTP